jgi:hypothetical protein
MYFMPSNSAELIAKSFDSMMCCPCCTTLAPNFLHFATLVKGAIVGMTTCSRDIASRREARGVRDSGGKLIS